MRVDHEWTTIIVAGEPWEVSRDAVRVDGGRITPSYQHAVEWAKKLDAQLPTPAVLDARWREADLKNRFHCQKLWEGENDAALHSRLIDEDIAGHVAEHGRPPRIVGNPGKCWTRQRGDGVCELYGIYAPAAEATTYRGTLMCWGLPVYESESDETEDYIAQRSSDSSHNAHHRDYMTTLTLCRPLNGSERAPDTEPSPAIPWHDGMDLATLTLGERCCAWLGQQYGLGVREIPGPEHDPHILSYSAHCRRGGTFLGVRADGMPIWEGGVLLALRSDDSDSPWCAALASETLRRALLPGEAPPHGLRVSVRELCEDARTAGTLRPVEWTPTPGSLAILARAGHNPLHGGPGHVRCVIQLDGDQVLCLGGNEQNRIVCGWHSLSSPSLRAWIER